MGLFGRRPLLGPDDAVRSAVAAVWAAGAWPTEPALARVLARAEATYDGSLAGQRWRDAQPDALPGRLAGALEALVRAGELEHVGHRDGQARRLRPSPALVQHWLPLAHARELRLPDEAPSGQRTPASACLAAAGNAEAPAARPVLDDGALVAAELRARAGMLALLGEQVPTDAHALQWHLQEEASLRSQVGDGEAARECWRRLAGARLATLAGAGQRSAGADGALALGALEDAVLARDPALPAAALAVAPAEAGLSTWGRAWQRTLRGLLLDEAAAVAEGAAELDRHDARKRRDSADVAVGAAARAVAGGDADGFREAVARSVDQHARYLRSGSSRGDASPLRSVMVLAVLARRRGLELPPEVGHRPVTVTLRCTDAWHGEPVHRHKARGLADLVPA